MAARTVSKFSAKRMYDMAGESCGYQRAVEADAPGQMGLIVR